MARGSITLYIFHSGYNLLGFAKALRWWQPDTWWQANATVHSACSQRGGYWSCQDRRLPHVMTFSACICCLLICCLALVVHVTAFWPHVFFHVGEPTACKIFTWWEYDGLGPLVMRLNVQSWRRRAPQCSEPVVLTLANVARWCKENHRDAPVCTSFVIFLKCSKFGLLTFLNLVLLFLHVASGRPRYGSMCLGFYILSVVLIHWAEVSDGGQHSASRHMKVKRQVLVLVSSPDSTHKHITDSTFTLENPWKSMSFL